MFYSSLINEISNHIQHAVSTYGVCNLMLTGGRSAHVLYKEWAKSFHGLPKSIRIYFSDERAVPADHPESNFHLATSTLFPFGMPEFLIVNRLAADAKNIDIATKNYDSILPDRIDILLLSMGEDGHIASMFPGSPALLETERKVMPIIGPKAPFQRLTITPLVIQAAKRVYVLAIGEEKRRKYEEALLEPEDISSIPARLVLDRTWIFDLDEEIDECPKL